MPLLHRGSFRLGHAAHLSDLIAKYDSDMKVEINSWAEDVILCRSEEDLIEYTINKYALSVPTLVDKSLHIYTHGETIVPLRNDSALYFNPDGAQKTIEGYSVIFSLEYVGDSDLFQFRPQRYKIVQFNIDLQDNTIRFSIVGHNLDENMIRRQVDEQIYEVREFLDEISKEASVWNDAINERARVLISERKSKLLRYRQTVAAIGIPILRRPTDSVTYSPPEVRRRLQIRPPPSVTQSFSPEPELFMDEYLNILGLIRKSAVTFERAPSTFSKFGEEELRNNLLVMLNSHYESATGETFNATGKTDILIRSEDRNVFIAECKFWEGMRSYLAAIEQIMSYLTWRDTKAAIIIFCRNIDFGSVIRNIETSTKSHSDFKRQIGESGEGMIRVVFRQRNDQDREIHLAVLAFHIPGSHT